MAELSETTPLQRYFGTDITPCTFEDWLQEIQARIDDSEHGHVLANHNLNSLRLLHKNSDFARFYRNACHCYIDGVPVRLILAGAGVRTTPAQRFTLMNCLPELLQYATRANWRLFYLGATEAVCDAAREKLAVDFPGLEIGIHHGYFQDDVSMVATINAFSPDVLLVGMGMPYQECWTVQHLAQLQAACITNVGASLDYVVGDQAKPPAWMSNAGVGWLYRLLHNPRRLWRRYLLDPWALVRPTLRLWREQRLSGLHSGGPR